MNIVMLTLKNGAKVPEPIVKVTMMSLQALVTSQPIVFYELVMKCRDRNHEYFGRSQEELQSRNLIQEDGQPHNAVRDVVLAAVEGEDLDMSLGSPIK